MVVLAAASRGMSDRRSVWAGKNLKRRQKKSHPLVKPARKKLQFLCAAGLEKKQPNTHVSGGRGRVDFVGLSFSGIPLKIPRLVTSSLYGLSRFEL